MDTPDLYYTSSTRSNGLYAKVERIGRRKHYRRLGGERSFVFHVGPKVKVFPFSKRAKLGQGIGGESLPVEHAPPTILKRLRDKYVSWMTGAAFKAASTSIVRVAKPKAAASLTLPGFGVKEFAMVKDLGYNLSKHERKYLEHLRRSTAENRGGYNLGLIRF